jgi:folylpolyglutamate synthase
MVAKGADENDIAQLKTQTELARAWKELNPSFSQDHIHVLRSIEHAIDTVRDIRKTTDKPVDTLVAGSLLLVGGLMEVAGLAKVALEV